MLLRCHNQRKSRGSSSPLDPLLIFCYDSFSHWENSSAVFLEHLIIELALSPGIDGSDLMAGTSLTVTDKVAVLGAGLSGHSKVSQTVLAHPHLHLAHMEVNEVVNIIGLPCRNTNTVCGKETMRGVIKPISNQTQRSLIQRDRR